MEISQLTLGQLGVYLKSWVGKSESDKKDDGYTDLELFNIMAGIPKKIVSRK